MKILSTRFSSVQIDDTIYSYDLYIFPNGSIEKRKKSSSPRIYGHRSLGVEEVQYLLDHNPDIIIIGTGQSGAMPISESAQKLLDLSNLKIFIDKTPAVIPLFNSINQEKSENMKNTEKSTIRIAAIFHLTC
ncbi:MAG: MTH938/NDUFAF3 family protein [Promethearchaeota archaeon]